VKDLKAILVWSMHIAGLEAKSVCKTASMHFIVCNARGLADVKWELLHLGSTPCASTICLPDFILHCQICPDFPFHVWILQILEVGTAWERGYTKHTNKLQNFLLYGIEIRHYTPPLMSSDAMPFLECTYYQ